MPNGLSTDNGLCFYINHLHTCCILSILFAFVLLSCARPQLITNRRAVMQEAIDSYLGTPYQFGGSSYKGIDCSGLVKRVYQRVGIDLPRNTHEQLKKGKRVHFTELRFGDVLFFKSPSKGQKGESMHAGIFMGDGRFVHASKSRGVIVDSLYKDYWRKLFFDGRRFLQ